MFETYIEWWEHGIGPVHDVYGERTDGWAVFAGCDGDDPTFVGFTLRREHAEALIDTFRDPDEPNRDMRPDICAFEAILWKGGLLTADDGCLKSHDQLAQRAEEALAAHRAERGCGGRDIALERQRQMDGEQWTQEHDDQWVEAELVRAAVAYALSAARYELSVFQGKPKRRIGAQLHFADGSRQWLHEPEWPWPEGWDKRPGAGASYRDRRRALVKAGALLAAEIDRLDREERRKAANGEIE